MYLYLLRLEKIFKVGITNDINRVYKLAKVYSKFGPRLHESYTVFYDKERTIKSLETLIHDYFNDYSYDFQGDTYEGYTEFFRNDCYDDVLDFVKFLIFKKNTNSSQTKMYLNKGIPLLTYPDAKNKFQKGKQKRNEYIEEIDQNVRSEFFSKLQIYKDKCSLKVTKLTDKAYELEISLNIFIKTDLPSLIYYYPSKKGGFTGGFNLFSSRIYNKEKELLSIFFYIQSDIIKYPKAIALYMELFEMLGLNIVFIKEIVNEYKPAH